MISKLTYLRTATLQYSCFILISSFSIPQYKIYCTLNRKIGENMANQQTEKYVESS